MFKIATFRRRELFKPGHVRIIAELVDAGVIVEIAGDGNDPRMQRHVRRLARRLHCGYSVPIHSRYPLTLGHAREAI
jgi:hypothetical protein